MCSDSETGSYLRIIDIVYHPTLGLRVIKKKKMRHPHSGMQRNILNNYFTEMCSISKKGPYLRLIDFCITQL